MNVLLYAFRADSRDHEMYRDWLEEVVNGPEAYGIAPQVLASEVRISTHARIFQEPSPVQEAMQFGRFLLAQPHATAVVPGDRHWSLFEGTLEASGATGNLVQGAWFAALALEWGCEWITTDQDYAASPGCGGAPPPDRVGKAAAGRLGRRHLARAGTVAGSGARLVPASGPDGLQGPFSRACWHEADSPL